ncbi:lantibiotic dehydratase family protein [Fodinicola feengrottensis]|uniref:lantibiotic dehydratase family protein n=1 Tax=Fodinicola feengrottensis TaxID=435914 RepID=UPI0013D61E96|nr:lantibiotic dehydratase family protein [Fodinicola feengrottensis]
MRPRSGVWPGNCCAISSGCPFGRRLFGAFAGVGLAEWGDRTDLSLSADHPRTHTRPDMGWLMDFVATVERRAEVRSGLNWYANPAAFVRADRLFLTERATIGDPAEAGRAVNLRATGAVRTALECARTPIPYEELIGHLSASGASRSKVEPFVQQLWEQTVLLTDLRPPLTIAHPARYVAEKLASIPTAAAEAAGALADLLTEIADWDRLDLDQAAPGYAKLAAKAQAAHEVVPSKDGPAGKGPLQTDLALSLENRQVSAAVASEVATLAETLLRLSPRPNGSIHLDEYRSEFETKYGSEREVPILELLDPKLGLGAPGHSHRPARASHSEQPSVRERTLVDLALNAIKDGQQVVELDAATMDKLQVEELKPANAPTSLDISAFVLARSAAAVDAGDFQVVIGPNLGAGSAGRVLGRFADQLGASAVAALQAVADAETARDSEKIRAEVTYLPRSCRLANVTIRPLVRDRELALGTTPGAALDRQLPVNELTVGIRDGRFVIRWPAADREVVPTAGHMLNTSNAPAIVRFLEEVSRDHRTTFSSFDWGPAAGFPFLPRVQLGRAVLTPARWQIPAGTLDCSAPQAFAASFGKWRERWQPPRYSYLALADNRLLLDLDEPDHLEQLRAESRKAGGDGPAVLLHEALPAPDHAWVPGADGTYLSELVVPVVLNSEEKTACRASAGRGRTTGRPTAPAGEAVATGQRLAVRQALPPAAVRAGPAGWSDS